jgi:hypothetical protein
MSTLGTMQPSALVFYLEATGSTPSIPNTVSEHLACPYLCIKHQIDFRTSPSNFRSGMLFPRNDSRMVLEYFTSIHGRFTHPVLCSPAFRLVFAVLGQTSLYMPIAPLSAHIIYISNCEGLASLSICPLLPFRITTTESYLALKNLAIQP